jgi:hypothetical protein
MKKIKKNKRAGKKTKISLGKTGTATIFQLGAWIFVFGRPVRDRLSGNGQLATFSLFYPFC